MNKCALIIPAGGSGKRMQQSRAKQFLEIYKKPLIYYTILPFLNLNFISEIIIPTHSNYIKEFKLWLESNNLNTRITVIEGGARRQDSVEKALNQSKTKISYVMIHDAVRPFVTRQLIKKIYQQGLICKHLIPVIPVKDTIKVIRDQKVIHTPIRSELYAIQTPQFFYLPDLKKSMKLVMEEEKEITDEAMALESSNITVHTINGEENNIKITTPEDLKTLERLKK